MPFVSFLACKVKVARAPLNVKEIEGTFHSFYSEDHCICPIDSFAFLTVENCSKQQKEACSQSDKIGRLKYNQQLLKQTLAQV